MWQLWKSRLLRFGISKRLWAVVGPHRVSFHAALKARRALRQSVSVQRYVIGFALVAELHIVSADASYVQRTTDA